MTVDINFGILYHEDDGEGYEYSTVSWTRKVKEDDGTDLRYTILSGSPSRSFPTFSFYSWIECVPEALELFEMCKKEHLYTNDFEYREIDNEVREAIGALPDRGTPLDVDRHKWFKYWCRRAVEEFGSSACIGFS